MNNLSQVLCDQLSGGRLKRESATAVEGNALEKGAPLFSRCDTMIEASQIRKS